MNKPDSEPHEPDPVSAARRVVDQATGQSSRRGPAPSMTVEKWRELADEVGLDVEIVAPPDEAKR